MSVDLCIHVAPGKSENVEKNIRTVFTDRGITKGPDWHEIDDVYYSKYFRWHLIDYLTYDQCTHYLTKSKYTQ